ncbi:NAC domain-containing protein 82-like isoform X3 [Juglans microcarpa x Juglans regia]|uniref:NAC domain-containing protein 82-like isoform X3 n=1 Tax=Juglans microcarpa x Juglans regia TaxID=2249226 RepID=UPI001B7F136C|nr:NAC domain-containing protein 82-like isoform X3 [Juglans microcarpa x Juglans regia]
MGKTSRLPPGFRFHPTDVELVMYYLKKKVMRKRFCSEPIAEIDIYKFAPWDLPERSSSRSGDLKWYFFCPVERKYLNGARMNRATEFGYWKTTGKDRPVHYSEELVGLIRTLIFHQGKAPGGQRTNWVLHEYRLEGKYLINNGVQNTHVLCMIFQKDGPGPRNGAQYGAPFKEQDWNDDEENCVEAGPSVCLSTLTSVLPGNCSSSVMAINSALGGTVAESCLSETMRSDSERLPATCTNNIVSKELPQALGDGDILPAVLANDGDNILSKELPQALDDGDILPAVLANDGDNILSKELPQALGDADILPTVLANDDDNVLSVFASFMEDDKNKNLSHGLNQAAHYLDMDIYKDLEDLETSFPGHLGIDMNDLELPLDAFPRLP